MGSFILRGRGLVSAATVALMSLLLLPRLAMPGALKTDKGNGFLIGISPVVVKPLHG